MSNSLDYVVYMKCMLVHFTFAHVALAIMHYIFVRNDCHKRLYAVIEDSIQYAWLLPYDLLFTFGMLWMLPSTYVLTHDTVNEYWVKSIAPTFLVTATSEIRVLFYFATMPAVVSLSMFSLRALVYLGANWLMFYVAF